MSDRATGNDARSDEAVGAQRGGADSGVVHDGGPSRSLFRNRDFRLLFIASAGSKFGTEVGYVGMPIMAVLALHATPGQVGLIGVLSTVAFLLIGLPAGAWVDRIRRRGVMVAADTLRALLLASVPVAWWLGVATLPWLYAVTFMNGILTVFFDVSAQSYLPSVVAKGRLLEANSIAGSLDGVTSISGPSLGGLLIQVASAPVAVLIDAITYLWSGICLSLIRQREAAPQSSGEKRMLRDIREGITFVFGHPLLRPLALTGTITNFSYQVIIVMMPVLYTRELGLSSSDLGIFLASGGIGSLLGAFTGPRVARRLGQGRSLWVVDVLAAPFCLLVPLAGHGIMHWVSSFAWLVLTYRNGMKNVVVVSFRQISTPSHLLGRMSATMRCMLFGALTVGAAVSGALAEYTSIRVALWVGAIGLGLTWVPIVFSPLRTMRVLPEQDSTHAPSCPER
ncbi:MFS transporter [Streptomyces sp. NPDC001118]